MKLTVLIFVMIVLGSTCRSQSLFAVYHIVSGKGSEKIGLPSQLRVTYNVWVDSNFVEIIGISDTLIVLGAEGKLGRNSSDEHVIISLKDTLAYYVNENRYAKVKIYDQYLVKKRRRLSTVTISSKKVTIGYSDDLPYYLTPGILLSNSKVLGGIKNVRSNELNIDLIKTAASPKNLNYGKYFVGRKDISGTLDFF